MGTMLVNLMHISVCRYDGAGAQCQSFGESAGSKILSEAETSFLKNIFELKQRKYPGIYALEPDILAGEIRDPAQEDSWILFGPILLAPANAARFQHAGRKFGKLEDIGLHLQICELNTLVAGMILYYGYLTGKELSLAEFLEYNKEEFPSVQKIHEQLGRDLFAHQEQAGIHNPYEQERREQDAIRHGDVAALNRSISETYEGKIGQLAKDPLRHHKNVAIGNITLASRAAIRGGMSTEKSFSLADSFSQQVEEIENLPEVEAFKREIKFTYARMVKEEKNNEIVEGENQGNPLIAQVKDYVFHHLHGAIQVQDIAQALQVNPDYLSHLFSTSENITMIEYIRQEKVRRGENLLKYSDYRVQDIAFYLGFSSQSHFARIFQKTTGMNPNEYRKTFGNKKKWKTKASESTQKNQEEKK